MTKSSQARKTRRQNKVVPMIQRQGLKLTDDEQLRLENLSLKIQVIQQDANAKIAPLRALQYEAAIRACKRLGIEPEAYTLEYETGNVVPKNGGPEEQPKEATDADAGEPEGAG